MRILPFLIIALTIGFSGIAHAGMGSSQIAVSVTVIDPASTRYVTVPPAKQNVSEQPLRITPTMHYEPASSGKPPTLTVTY